MATLINARLVSRFGMRRLAHSALLLFIIANALHLAVITTSGETFFLFMIFMSISFFSLGLIGPNATAMAMEPMGHVAGAAAAANGFAGTAIAGFLGGAIGQLYDGTTTPLVTGFVCLGIAALIIVLWAEKGVLFHPHEKDNAS